MKCRVRKGADNLSLRRRFFSRHLCEEARPKYQKKSSLSLVKNGFKKWYLCLSLPKLAAEKDGEEAREDDMRAELGTQMSARALPPFCHYPRRWRAHAVLGCHWLPLAATGAAGRGKGRAETLAEDIYLYARGSLFPLLGEGGHPFFAPLPSHRSSSPFLGLTRARMRSACVLDGAERAPLTLINSLDDSPDTMVALPARGGSFLPWPGINKRARDSPSVAASHYVGQSRQS